MEAEFSHITKADSGPMQTTFFLTFICHLFFQKERERSTGEKQLPGLNKK